MNAWRLPSNVAQLRPLACTLNNNIMKTQANTAWSLHGTWNQCCTVSVLCMSVLRRPLFSCLQVHRELMPEPQHPTRETLRPNCVTSTGNWKPRATAKDQGSWSGWNMSEESLNSDLTRCWQVPSVHVPDWSSVVTTYWKTPSTRSCATRVKTCREASFTSALWEKRGEYGWILGSLPRRDKTALTFHV